MNNEHNILKIIFGKEITKKKKFYFIDVEFNIQLHHIGTTVPTYYILCNINVHII